MHGLTPIFQKYKQSNLQKNIIYTAVFGNFDQLSEIHNPSQDIDYICFTDNKLLVSSTWKIIVCTLDNTDPRKCAKIFKIFPHEFFPNSELTLWVDGNYVIKKNHYHFFKENDQITDIKFFRHSQRNCIYDEGDFIVQNKSEFDPVIIKKQLSCYQDLGFPGKHGLINGAIILRNSKNKTVKKLMSDWWDEIENHSIRDQLSFNYVCWKNNHHLKYFNEEISNFQFFQYLPHGSKMNFFSLFNVKILLVKILKKLNIHVRNS